MITRQKLSRKDQIRIRQEAGHYLGVRCTLATHQPTLLPDLSLDGDHFDAIIQYDITTDRYKVIRHADHTLVVEGSRQAVIAKLIPCLPIVDHNGAIKFNFQDLKQVDNQDRITPLSDLEVGDQVAIVNTAINDGLYRVIRVAGSVADVGAGTVAPSNFSGVIVQRLARGGAYPCYHPAKLKLNIDHDYWVMLQGQGSIRAVFRYPLDWLSDDQPLPIGTRIKWGDGDQVFCLTDRGHNGQGLWVNEDDSKDHVMLADDLIRRGDHVFQNMIFDNGDSGN